MRAACVGRFSGSNNRRLGLIPQSRPQSQWLSLAHAREATNGRKRFNWFENAVQFDFGLVLEAVGLVWCGFRGGAS